MPKFYLKLSQINRDLKSEGLPQVSKQQAMFMMNKTPARCKNPLIDGEHYQEEKRGKYSVYFYSDDGVRFLFQWAIAKKQKERQ